MYLANPWCRSIVSNIRLRAPVKSRWCMNQSYLRIRRLEVREFPSRREVAWRIFRDMSGRLTQRATSATCLVQWLTLTLTVVDPEVTVGIPRGWLHDPYRVG